MDVVLWLAVLCGGGLVWLHVNLDRLLRDAIVQRGSDLLGTTMRLGAVRVEPISGRGTVTGLVIDNPPGFRTPHALKVDRIVLSIEIASLLRDVIRIRRIEVVSPHLIYEKGAKKTNLQVLQANLAAGAAPKDSAAAPEAGEDKRWIVATFILRDAKVEASAAFMAGKTVGIQLPDICLRDVGREQGGVTAAAFGRIVVDAIERGLASGFSFDTAARAITRGIEKAGAAIRGIFE